MTVAMTMMVAIAGGDGGDDDDGVGLRSYLLMCRRSYIRIVTEEVHAFFQSTSLSLRATVVYTNRNILHSNRKIRGKHKSGPWYTPIGTYMVNTKCRSDPSFIYGEHVFRIVQAILKTSTTRLATSIRCLFASCIRQ